MFDGVETEALRAQPMISAVIFHHGPHFWVSGKTKRLHLCTYIQVYMSCTNYLGCGVTIACHPSSASSSPGHNSSHLTSPPLSWQPHDTTGLSNDIWLLACRCPLINMEAVASHPTLLKARACCVRATVLLRYLLPQCSKSSQYEPLGIVRRGRETHFFFFFVKATEHFTR